jgi:hypothetical protein
MKKLSLKCEDGYTTLRKTGSSTASGWDVGNARVKVGCVIDRPDTVLETHTRLFSPLYLSLISTVSKINICCFYDHIKKEEENQDRKKIQTRSQDSGLNKEWSESRL